MSLYREITSAKLQTGGNVIRQGYHFTQGYIPRDSTGANVDLSGKTIIATVFTKQGIRYEGPASFDAATGEVSYTVAENIGHGTMWAEFTVTDAADASYRQKFPSNERDTKMEVIRGIDDLSFVGAGGVTVAQLRNEQQDAQTAYEVTVDGKIETYVVESADLKAEFNAAMAALTVDSEVVVARGSAATLGERLDETAVKFAETEADLDSRGANLLNYGIISDGTTDQTTALIALFENEFLNYRGKLHVPYNTKFDVKQVYPKIPVGIVVWDESQINFANSTGYKNKFFNIVSSDRTNDDTGLNLISGHHAAMFLNNLGTSKEEDGVTLTPSALARRTSIMFAGGIKDNKDPLLGNIFQHYMDKNKWVFGYRNYTKFADPTTATDKTIFQLDEDGRIAIGGGGVDDTYPVKMTNPSPTNPIYNLLIDNPVVGGDTYLRLRTKKADGTTQQIYLRYDKEGVFSVRNSINSTLMSVSPLGEVRAFGGINGNGFTSSNRPTTVVLGTMIFDTTINKPIWYKGASQWVDAMGEVV